MVVETDSTLAGEEGEVAEPPQPLPECLIGWNTIHGLPPDAAVSPPPKTPWSIVAIKNNEDRLIFPPINHENLRISADYPPTPDQIPHIYTDNRQVSFSDSDSNSDPDSDSNSSVTFSPSDSSPVPRSPLFCTPNARPAADSVGWFDLWTKILHPKVSVLVRFLCISFSSSRGVFVTFRSATFTAMLIAFLYFRRRRRLKAREESRDHLIGIIKERDEKINQLLDQISRMNQVLLGLQRVPTNPSP